MADGVQALRILGAALATAGLAACSPPAGACGGLTDRQAAQRVIDDYAKKPASQRGDPAETQFDLNRVKGVGRGGPDGAQVIQIWFAQDDHTLTVVSLTAGCTLQVRPGLAPDAIANAAFPVRGMGP